MSDPGLPEISGLSGTTPSYSTRDNEVESSIAAQGDHMESTLPVLRQHPRNSRCDVASQTNSTTRSPVQLRLHFDEFAAQLRQHRRNEHRQRMLEHRRTQLQKAVALTGRLQRVSSWLHDGLVEISRSTNAADFVKVHQHLLNLTNDCLTHWEHNIRSHDTISNARIRVEPPIRTSSFLSRISTPARNDCLDFIQRIRSKPKFVVDCFKAVSPSQLVALSTAPRFSDLGAYIARTSSQRIRSPQKKRIQSYSKVLEDYASAFERKNPLAFLIHNCFADSSADRRLRLETWSSICASLHQDLGQQFLACFHQILWEFAALDGWRAKVRLELFLMDVLQRGAFLLEPIGDYKKSNLDNYIANTLETQAAQEFFDEAVCELLEILYEEDGGFPAGVLQITRTILAKISDEALQSQIRGHVLGDWFLTHFLQTAIAFPENHKMLLQFYISDSARSTILQQLWQRVHAKAYFVLQQESLESLEPEIIHHVYGINNQLYAEPIEDVNEVVDRTAPAIALCATDLVHVLEALSQQYTNVAGNSEGFMHRSMTLFTSLSSSAHPKLDRLRRELLLLSEPGQSTAFSEPISEQWLILVIEGSELIYYSDVDHGSRDLTPTTLFSGYIQLNAAEQAAVRLALDDDAATALPDALAPGTHRRLDEAFRSRARHERNLANMVDANFWHSAADVLHERYALADTPQAESRLLCHILSLLRLPDQPPCRALEAQTTELEDAFSRARISLDQIARRLDSLKIKMWYTMSVVNSSEYEIARNVSKALNYMALPPLSDLEATQITSPAAGDRPSTSASTTSSLFEQPQLDTMKILRAPREHGGPKKLSDEQIDVTKRWLSRNNVENFCTGEERIHRFCMEIKMATRKLVGENATESPVLWYSELWAREKSSFEAGPAAFVNIATSTRSPSIISETQSSAWTRPVFGSVASSRSLDGHEVSIAPSLASRSTRATSGEFAWSALLPSSSKTRSQTSNSAPSQAPSLWSQSSYHQSRSQTSASLQSRPPSLYNDFTTIKSSDTIAEKNTFLESLRQSLTVLLLSDLGNPVWSLGCETDAWMDSHRQTPAVAQRLARRQAMGGLIPLRTNHISSNRRNDRPQVQQRSWSVDDCRKGVKGQPTSGRDSLHEMLGPQNVHELNEMLMKISRQVDANAKLQAVADLRKLALLVWHQSSQQSTWRAPAIRRQSLGSEKSSSNACSPTGPMPHNDNLTDSEVGDYLKDLLLTLRPRTLFRDLQFIAAFASPEALNNSESGRLFIQVGLAALASKDEMCRTMVELADKIVARDAVKRKGAEEDRDQTPSRAREYWIISAREGNAVAQRELAGLYLAHPEVSVPPTVTAPLSLSGDVFRKEMMWAEGKQEDDQPSLCLALHWMQLAAAGGDAIARQRLEDRSGGG